MRTPESYASKQYVIKLEKSHDALLKALNLHRAFLNSLPKGWLGHTTGDIGLFNDAELLSIKAVNEAVELKIKP